MEVVIYWNTNDRNLIKKVQEELNIPLHTTINGESYATVKEEYVPLLRERIAEGIIQLRNKR